MSLEEYYYNLATGAKKGILAFILRLLLLPFCLVYGLFIRVLLFWNLLTRCKLPLKVISVGNISMGGTGKTSLVELIAGFLTGQEKKPAVITRGYKAPKAGKPDSASGMGDEPFMLKKKLAGIPVIVDPNRKRAALKAFREGHCDTAILDDGFQQWGIKKDLEIVTVDSSRQFGNNQMIPLGILREPLSGLSRAQVLVIFRVRPKDDTGKMEQAAQKINPKLQIFHCAYEAKSFIPLGIKGQMNPLAAREKTALLCGIGNPASFEALAAGMGLNVAQTYRFPDHYFFRKADIEQISWECKHKGIKSVVTTEKDAVRLSELDLGTGISFWALSVRVRFLDNEQEFLDRLLRVYTS